MNKEEQEIYFKEFTKRMANTMLKKGNDYANTDRLSNFKLAGGICQTSAKESCLNQIANKVARLGVLFKSNEVNNESIEDSILDLANYTVLLAMIISEDNKQTL